MVRTALVRIAIGLLWIAALPAAGATVTVDGHEAGATPFISLVHLTVSDADALRSVQFTVASKPGSAVRPIQARYSRNYLENRGHLNAETGEVVVPVFGLYAGFTNSVKLDVAFRGGSARRFTVEIPTEAFDDPSGIYLNPTVVQARSRAVGLSYDYIMMKGYVGGISPILIDTDGQVRWVGTAGAESQPAIFFENGIYVGRGTELVRMELDGEFGVVEDYAKLGVTGFHHNFELGKRGFLAQVDTTEAIESVVLELDGSGQVLETWDMNAIVGAAMQAGGDDASAFVKDGEDWFHNNSCTYQKSTDSVIISSRESFVIALDYETDAIQWILGDPGKAWYTFSSLRQFALTLGKNTLPPIGQHALSMVRPNQLMLFDNGANSGHHVPPGDNRDYSAARRYRIDAKKRTATETWTYVADPSIYSPFCSSIYRDGQRSYLIDYTLAGPLVSTDIVGLTAGGRVAFRYSYPVVSFCGVAWNASVIHLEKLVFD